MYVGLKHNILYIIYYRETNLLMQYECYSFVVKLNVYNTYKNKQYV